jgi:hypothetical protein
MKFFDASDFSRIGFVTLGMVACAAASGCAHFDTRSSSRKSSSSSDQVIKADPHSGDPLTALEQELTKVHSERVIVSTALLKSLVKNERLHQNQCKNISGQLEAIKNIDLEETGEERQP